MNSDIGMSLNDYLKMIERAKAAEAHAAQLEQERDELKALVASFTGQVRIYEYPDEPEAGDYATILLSNGRPASATTAWSIEKFRVHIERRFPAPKNCAWAFYVCTAQIVRVQA